MPFAVAYLPVLNAVLNAVSAILLVAGYSFVRRWRVAEHRRCMPSAFGGSSLFLIGYLTLRYFAGMTRFMGQGWIRPVYFTILISQMILVAALVPLACLTLWRALRGRFDRHVRIAR